MPQRFLAVLVANHARKPLDIGRKPHLASSIRPAETHRSLLRSNVNLGK